MFESFNLTPAYGRDYKSKKALLVDFEKNMDFKMNPSGQYVSKSQLAGKQIQFRYGKLRKTFIHNV